MSKNIFFVQNLDSSASVFNQKLYEPREWQEKVDLVDRDIDDTVEYAFKNKYIFRPDLSEGLTGDEELTMPHVFILAMVMSAVREKPTMMPIVSEYFFLDT